MIARISNACSEAAGEMPAACGECAIRELGEMTLAAGAVFYVMTSAKDILLDVYVPALEERRFRTGVFTLCRYSLRPFAVGCLASGVKARLIPFAKGDCSDYRTWLLADRGIKEERTEIAEVGRAIVKRALSDAAARASAGERFERSGNVPLSAGVRGLAGGGESPQGHRGTEAQRRPRREKTAGRLGRGRERGVRWKMKAAERDHQDTKTQRHKGK